MGLVRCEKHGDRSGPMCCEHVLDAVYGRSAGIEYRMIKCDILGDGVDILQHLVCIDCLAKYALTGKEFVGMEVWENEALFPWVCPVCIRCLQEYERKM